MKIKKTPPKKFQEYIIKKSLKLNSAQIHKCSIDSKLRIDENMRLCKKKLHISDNRLGPQTKSMNKVERYLKIREVFDKRKNHSQFIDSTKRAKHTFEEMDLNNSNFIKWLDKPNRYDVIGVDAR